MENKIYRAYTEIDKILGGEDTVIIDYVKSLRLGQLGYVERMNNGSIPKNI